MAFNYISFGLQQSDVIGLTVEQRTAIEFQLTVSIVNEGTWLYRNFKLPRYKNSYGYAQIMSGAYVVETVQLEYLNHQILFFESDTFDIDDNIACATRAILGALTPPSMAAIKITKHRTHITSVRFRLYSGIVANVGIRWVTPVSNCGNAIEEPDKRQNEPIAPNNGSSSPGSRPPEQGGDASDRSPNDGGGQPGDGLPPPPTPGGGTYFPSWHVNGLITVNAGCIATPYHYKYNDLTDPAIVPYFVPTGPNSVCSNSKNGDLIYGGAAVDHPNGVIDYTMSFY